MNEPTTVSSTNGSEILAFLPPEVSEHPAQIPPAAPGPIAPGPATPPAPEPEQPAAPKTIGRVWTYEGKIYDGKHIWKDGKTKYESHQVLLDRGVRPEEIPHIPWGLTRGCQHEGCKIDRKEYREEIIDSSRSEDVVEVAQEIISDLLAAEVVKDLLNLPNEIAQLICEIKKLPKNLQEIWAPTVQELQNYEKYGTFLVKKYLKIPDFEHKEAILFALYYISGIVKRLMKTVLVLKSIEASKPKEIK